MRPTQRIGSKLEISAAAREDLSLPLHLAYRTGARAWPNIRLSYELFQSHAARLGYACLGAPAYPAELYLCIACANGQYDAYQAFEDTYFPALRVAVQNVLRPAPCVDDVLQEVRTRLFVGHSPKIVLYRGSGSLCGWLRRVAVNVSQDYRRAFSAERHRLSRVASTELVAATSARLDDERAAGRDGAQPCERAWNTAILSLSSADRQLLYHYFVSGLSIDALGPMYSVHRATIARRVRRAIDRVGRRTRQALALHYPDLGRHELHAMLVDATPEIDLIRALHSRQSSND